MNFSILGTGSYAPPRIVTNDELATMMPTSDEWITQRVGVKERHVCTTETAADLALEAARRALENSHTRPEELDMILVATVSNDNATPGIGCLVQRDLGATCPTMDLNAACSGFLFMLETAAAFFARGRVRRMLVIGAEHMSRLLEWDKAGVCVIFGDGAGAAVLGPGEDLLASRIHTYGGDSVICVPNYVGASPFFTGEARPPFVQMNGQETYKFAVNAMCRDLMQVLEDAHLQGNELAYVVPHQANYRIIQGASHRLPIPEDRFYVNIDRYGNTSAASVPMALDELNRAGKLHAGDLVAMCAFGGGLSSAACILRWSRE